MRAAVEFLRYFALTLGGLATDFALALVLAALGLDLALAAAFGVLAGAVVNFLLYRRYAFAEAAAEPVAGQIAGYVLGVALVLGVRVAAVAVLARVVPSAPDAPLLAAATGLSFVASYLFNRNLVFRRRRAR